jgi:hypothetical protein
VGRASALLGVCLGGIGLLALPVLVAGSSGRDDLVVDVRAQRPFSVVSEPQSAASIAERVVPQTASRTELGAPNVPGLTLTTWRVHYGPYDREVTWPVLAGPFAPEDQHVCGYSVHAGAALFDTSGAGEGLAAALRRKLAEKLPKTIPLRRFGIADIPLPPLRSVALGVRLGWGRAYLSVSINFEDGTVFGIPSVPVRLAVKDGAPALVLAGPIGQPIFRGPIRDKIVAEARSGRELEGCLFGAVFGFGIGALVGCPAGADIGEDEANNAIPRKARTMARAVVKKALAQLALGMAKLTRPIHPIESRPNDELRLRLARDPVVSPGGITLPVCARITVAPPKVDAAIPGPITSEKSTAATLGGGAPGPVIAVSLNSDALDQVMYYLWQSGALKRLGRSPTVFGAFGTDVRAAAFTFTGFSPGLPPTLASNEPLGSGLPFVLGDVVLGRLGPKNVTGHALVDLQVVPQNGAVTLRATLPDVRVNCVELGGGRARLTPCLADLLPIAREEIAKRPLTESWRGADLLAKLPALGFDGIRLRLSSLSVLTARDPIRLDLSARARFE